jgi:hypothetical protein
LELWGHPDFYIYFESEDLDRPTLEGTFEINNCILKYDLQYYIEEGYSGKISEIYEHLQRKVNLGRTSFVIRTRPAFSPPQISKLQQPIPQQWSNL